MRSVTPAPARCALVLASALGLALAGCSLDLDLPGEPTSPTVTGFSPPAAYAGQLLQLQGGHFAADAAENTVNFAHASVRAEGWAGSDLLVRVPGDAGDGPITVSNREGTSAATAEPFAYRGLGELRRGQLLSTEPILHHPLRVHAVAGGVFIESALLRLEGTQRHGLVQYGSPAAFPGAVSTSATGGPWNTLYYTVDDATGAFLTAVPMDGTTPPTTVHLDVHPWRILPVRVSETDPTQDLLVVFDLDPVAGERISTLALADLSPVLAPTALAFPATDPVSPNVPLTAISSPADVGDGRVIAIARDPVSGAGLVVVVSVADGSVVNHLHAPGSRVITLNAGDRYGDGLAAIAHGAGSHTAVVALDTGWVGLVNLGALPTPTAHHEPSHDWTAYVDLVGTYSSAAVRGIATTIAIGASAAARPVAIVTKPDDDLVLGIEISSASVAWGLPTRAAWRLAARDGIAWVANDADNELQVINADLGRQVGRLAFDVAPGTFDAFGDPDPAGGLVFAAADPLDPFSVDTLFVMALSPPAILKRPLDSYEPASCLFRDETLTQVAWDAASRTPWGLERALYADPLRALAFTGASPATVPIAGAAGARRIVFTPSGAVVAHDAGLAAIATGGGAVAGSVAVTDPIWGSVAPAPDGRVWLTGTWDGADHVQLWSHADVATGGAPDAEFTADPTLWIFWGVWLEDGLWVDTWDGVSDPAMVRLVESGGVLQSAETVTPAAAGSFLLIPPAAVSPNGRTLVMWEYRGLDTALRLFSADPSTGFAELGYIPLDGTITGAAFDDTGERLYVVTQAPDRVVIID
jgi:hypothetical protein